MKDHDHCQKLLLLQKQDMSIKSITLSEGDAAEDDHQINRNDTVMSSSLITVIASRTICDGLITRRER